MTNAFINRVDSVIIGIVGSFRFVCKSNQIMNKNNENSDPNTKPWGTPVNDFVRVTESAANFYLLVPVCKILSNIWNRIFIET